MKTAQVEKEFGVPRKTLFYYEESGLLHPQRLKNGYREYTDEDLRRIRVILLMRSMEIPLADIREVLEGNATFRNVLRKQEERLRTQAEKIEEAHSEAEYILRRRLPPADYGMMLKGRRYGVRRKVCICRRKYRPDYVRQIRYGVLWAGLMFWFWLYGYAVVLRNMVPLWAALLNWVVIAGVIFWYVIRQEPFLEFDERGVRFLQPTGIRASIRYFLYTMQGKGDEYLRFYEYEQIRLVKVRTVCRLMRPAPQSQYLLPEIQIDYRLEIRFADGGGYRLDFPYTFMQDQQLCAAILLQKSQETDDPDGVLKLMADGKNLTEEWLKKDGLQ